MSNINESVRNILDRNGEVLKTLIIDNITIEKAENGQSELSLNTTNDMLNVHNMVHGGVLFSLADSTAGASCVSFGKKVVTLNSSINYIKPMGIGKIIAKGEVVHKGNNTMVSNVSVYDSSTNSLLCTGTFTFFVIGQY